MTKKRCNWISKIRRLIVKKEKQRWSMNFIWEPVDYEWSRVIDWWIKCWQRLHDWKPLVDAASLRFGKSFKQCWASHQEERRPFSRPMLMLKTFFIKEMICPLWRLAKDVKVFSVATFVDKYCVLLGYHGSLEPHQLLVACLFEGLLTNQTELWGVLLCCNVHDIFHQNAFI